jgi:hypothetical protein
MAEGWGRILLEVVTPERQVLSTTVVSRNNIRSSIMVPV